MDFHHLRSQRQYSLVTSVKKPRESSKTGNRLPRLSRRTLPKPRIGLRSMLTERERRGSFKMETWFI
jgi:hypothetical protein